MNETQRFSVMLSSQRKRNAMNSTEFSDRVEFLLNFRNPAISYHVNFCKKKNLFKRISLKKITFSIAGAGFEPYDLRVMSPTSYQTALPRDIQFRQRKCRTPGSNRYDTFVSRDFKSRASANSATPAHSPALGASLCCSFIIAQL